jgi:8-oxo-dGTP pyrophosphatase MutT (NUDIX family)
MHLGGYKRPDLDAALKLDPQPRESAVLALIYPRAGSLHTLLMLRPEYDGVHSGQVAFPGGRREEQDATLQDTALREFTEETGATTDPFTLLGELSRVYIPPSRSLVTPFLAYTEELPPTRPDPREVAALIETPLEELLRPDVVQVRRQYIQVLGREAEIPYFDLQGQVVWGATAMMLAELRELLLRLR